VKARCNSSTFVFSGATITGHLVDLVNNGLEGTPPKVRGMQYQPSDYTLALIKLRQTLVDVPTMAREDAVQLLKRTLSSSDSTLAHMHEIKDNDVVLEGVFDGANTTYIPCGLSKRALLSLHDSAQLNSEVIDGFVAFAVQEQITLDNIRRPRFVPAKLMPSTPDCEVPSLSWKWIEKYLANATTFLFLLHEEHVLAESGHFILLYVDIREDIIHVLDPSFTNVRDLTNRIGQLSHLTTWVPAFFTMHGVSMSHETMRLKLALPMSHRSSQARRKLPVLSRSLVSCFNMHTQVDAVSCGVVCAQVASQWVRTGSSPLHGTPLEDCTEFRGTMLHALHKALFFCGE
jgi:hypothetical protein